MSKKHFQALAAALKDYSAVALGDSATAKDPQALLADLVWNIAEVCAQTNPRFDRARFLAACGVTAEGQ